MFRIDNIEVEDTFAELFPAWAGRVIVTAENEKWAMTAARVATGFSSSIMGSPAEAGIEKMVSPEETPDGRTGSVIQIYHRTRRNLRTQMVARMGQCVMTCPTTSAFDGLTEAKRRLRVGRSLRYFGDGFQKRDRYAGRRVWRIPVMEGEFIVEDSFGSLKAFVRGNFLILAKDMKSGLSASEASVNAIHQSAKEVILPFPGGICRSGTKSGSRKYKLTTSTHHLYCPRLRKLVSGSKVPNEVKSIYEIVINGLKLESVKSAMAEGIRAAAGIQGVVGISAVNYGGNLGPFHVYLHEILS